MEHPLPKTHPHIVIVGGSGFIGSAIATEARRNGLTISILPAPRIQGSFPQTYEADPPVFSEADIESITSKLRGASVVINAAGISDAGDGDLQRLIVANAALPRLLAQASAHAGAGRFIHISSAAVQGTTILDETARVAPFSPYSKSKALGERWLADVPTSNLQITIIRPTSVHGVDRRVTNRVVRLASGIFSSFAGAPRSTPQTLAETVARTVVKIATHRGALPHILLTPDEGLTTESFLRLVGGRQPTRVPELPARCAVVAAKALGRLHPRFASFARRLELLWFGQPRESGKLDSDLSLLARPEQWRQLRDGSSELTVLFGVTSGHSVRPFFTGMHSFLSQQGWKVVLTCTDEADASSFAASEGSEHRPITAVRSPHPVEDIRTLVQLVRLLRELRPNVAVWGTPKLGLLGPLASRITGTPSVYVVHGLRLQTVRQPMKAILHVGEYVSMRAASEVVAVGKELKREIVTTRLAPEHRVTVLRHGSANGVRIPELIDKSTAERGRSAHFAFVGRVTPDKGIDKLLDAWATVVSIHPTATLTVAGALEVSSQHPLVSKLLTSPGVHYVGHLADTSTLYPSLTALVLPSLREGLPTVVLEAAAHGVPAVVTASTGTSEPVVPGRTGIVVPVADAPALASAMIRLAEDPSLAIEMGVRARAHVEANYAQEPLWRTWDIRLREISRIGTSNR